MSKIYAIVAFALATVTMLLIVTAIIGATPFALAAVTGSMFGLAASLS